MKNKIILKKEDYKRYKKCIKIFWTFANYKNFQQVKQWINDKKISVFFDLTDKTYDNNIEINKNNNMLNNFLIKNTKKYNTNIYNINSETLWITNKQKWKWYNLKSINIKNIFYTKKRIIDGLQVGKKAQKYFEKKYNCFNLEKYNKKKSLKKTKKILKNNKYQILFEPTFQYKNYITKCDILKRMSNNAFHLIEVKAGIAETYNAKIDQYCQKTIKKDYIYDMTFQYYVLKKCGIKINKISLMLLNPNYYNNNNNHKLFILQDKYFQKNKINTQISLIKFIKKIIIGEFFNKNYENKNNIEFDLNYLQNFYKKTNYEILNIFQDKYCCNGKNINFFNYYGYCQHVTLFLPKHNNVFELVHGLGKKTLLLYEENKKLLSEIIIPFKFRKQLNNNLKNDFNLSQTRQIQMCQNNDQIINLQQINDILKVYSQYNKYPIYMYDFEAMQAAIPIFEYSYPYQQIPFQYSIHIIQNNIYDYNNLTNIQHLEYLSNGENDPRLQLIINFIKDSKIYNKGIYVAYHKSFECKIIYNLIKYLEYLKNKTNNIIKNKYFFLKIKDLWYIYNNTIDLKDFFKNFMIYKKEFYGSKSIKMIQPAFDKQFSYKNLKIQNGDISSEIFWYKINNIIKSKIWFKYFRKLMLEYCKHDTLSMVIILQNIKVLLEKNNFINKKLGFNNEKI